MGQARRRIHLGLRIAFIASCCLCGFAGHAQGPRVLQIRPHAQHTLVWCWAASAAMVIEYATGRPTEDCQVLEAYDRALGGLGRCCSDPRPCLRGGKPGEIESILGTLYRISGHTELSPPSFGEMAAQIDRGGPLILWLWRTPTSAHVVVASGYDANGRVQIMDPMQGPVWVAYPVLRANWMTGVWRETIFVDGPEIPQSEPEMPPPAHWCCTNSGRFGPYLPNDVPLGAPCQWPTPFGPAVGVACN